MIKQNKSFLDKVVKLDKEDPFRRENLETSYAQAPEPSYGFQEPAKMEYHPEPVEESEDGQLALDVYQDNDYVIIKSIIGGIRPEDLDLSVAPDMITIKGSRRKSEEVADENYYCKECFWGSFSRTVILPCDIRTDAVEASMKNGVLTIRMSKVEKNQTTKVTVLGE